MLDWQTLVVALIILAALFYTGRRAWSRLRSFRADAPASCATGCGKCETSQPIQTAARPANLPVQISRQRTPTKS